MADSTARDRAIEVAWNGMSAHDPDGDAGPVSGGFPAAIVDALCASPDVLRALAGEAEPTPAGDGPPMWLTSEWGVIEPDGSGNYRTIENGAYVEALPADAVRLVPAGGSAPADEVEQLRWERDMALSRVAAAEAVEVRMGDSLPASGPVDSWSERDRAVRDYEGDLATALATETDTVGERLREVERERDEALAEVERLTAALQPPVDAEYLSDVERNAVALAAEMERMRPVVEAAIAWQTKRLNLNYPPPRTTPGLDDSTTSIPEAGVLYAAALTYQAALSAPVEAGTTPRSFADERLAQARDALVATGYFRPEEVGDDIAPRIIELHSALTPDEVECARCAHRVVPGCPDCAPALPAAPDWTVVRPHVQALLAGIDDDGSQADATVLGGLAGNLIRALRVGTPAAEPAPDDLLGRLQRSLLPRAGAPTEPADDTPREKQS